MFVDESGTEKHTVLAGVIVRGSEWKLIQASVEGLKKRYFPDHDPNKLELRSHDIRNQKKAYATLEMAEYRDFLGDLSLMIQKLPFSLVAALIDNDLAMTLYPHLGDVYELAYTFLLERFQMHIQGSNSYGLVICDARSKAQDCRCSRFLPPTCST